MKSSALVLIGCAVSLATATVLSFQSENPRPGAETAREAGNPPPHSAADLFTHSDNCLACHNNLVTPAGVDVSIGANWRGTIMANASRDPYFHASLRRETLDHATHAAEIQDECSACHLPAARRMALAEKRPIDVFAHIASLKAGAKDDVDALATDGVTCTVCHQIAPEGLGTPQSFNGNFTLARPLASGNRPALGPHAPDAGRLHLMQSVTGFDQHEAPHIRQSELCATCHTLITSARGPDGSVIGSLPEQMNYQEWRHSAYDEEQRSCQSCHMPVAEGPMRISSVLGQNRAGLSRHTFLGGNAFMLRMLNRYRAELGVEASPAELETVANATMRQMESATATVSIDRFETAQNTLVVDVTVTNLTGHKLPTGYPSRRAWLHVTARTGSGTILFESGRLADTGLIEGNDADIEGARFEPHYPEITGPEQVQIYESIMGTPTGTPTTGLLQATQYLKDNRLLPRGFDKRTAPPEIRVFGQAADDADFTDSGDRVRYRIPWSQAGAVTVEVELRYQPIGYRWAQNLRSYRAPEPQSFLSYYDAMATTSSLVVAKTSRQFER